MRCGLWFNRVDLKFQHDWRGATVQNLWILVCRQCYDTPQEQLRAITLPADPEPVFYPSVQDFDAAEIDYRTLAAPTVLDPVTGIPIPGTTLRVTEDGQNRVTTPFGRPVGLDQNAVMPFDGSTLTPYGVPLQVLSVMADDSATVVVTCSAVHKLHALSQVSIRGLSYAPACGFYTVSVISATAFSYMTYGANPAGSLLTPTTRIITAKIGLPRGFVAIPKIYGPALKLQTSCFLDTESGGIFQLQSGGFLQLQTCRPGPVPLSFLVELESGTGTLLLDPGTGSLELQIGP
jgi:hypothetical protein